MLLFKNAETGVEISEALRDVVGVALSSRRPPFRAAKGVVTCEGLDVLFIVGWHVISGAGMNAPFRRSHHRIGVARLYRDPQLFCWPLLFDRI
jgi:hypothetical protein